MDITFLPNRAIIEIKGEDRKNFLQGLLTNDINKISDKNLIYSAMLNAQGRFLYDFFIFEKNDSVFLECSKLRRDEIFTKLKFYKLRAKVDFIKNDELKIFWCQKEPSNQSNLIFKDSRHIDFGFRIYCADNIANTKDETAYDYKRIMLKIAEDEKDLTYEKSIIAEFNFDNLNAVDYKKGCYIGQELTARTHYMGQVRKKITHITIDNLQKVAKNSEISCEGKNNGIILSSVFYKNTLHALALIKIDESEEVQKYSVFDNKITIIS